MKASDFGRFGGSLTADVLEFNPDAIPKPDTLYVRMTRGERRIADELRMEFGGFKRVVIDVDGEQHEFSADSLVQMLEDYEDAQGMSNYMRLFGTPESAARTVAEYGKTIYTCDECLLCHDHIGATCEINGDCPWVDGESGYDALLEWLKGGSDG